MSKKVKHVAKTRAAPKVHTTDIDDMNVGEILGLVDNLCDEIKKYFRYGKDLKLAYRVAKKANNLENVYDAIGLNYPYNASPPAEAVAALKLFFKQDMYNDDFIYSRLNSYFSHDAWSPKFKMTTEKEDVEFIRFKKGLVDHINKANSIIGVKVTFKGYLDPKKDRVCL